MSKALCIYIHIYIYIRNYDWDVVQDVSCIMSVNYWSKLSFKVIYIYKYTYVRIIINNYLVTELTLRFFLRLLLWKKLPIDINFTERLSLHANARDNPRILYIAKVVRVMVDESIMNNMPLRLTMYDTINCTINNDFHTGHYDCSDNMIAGRMYIVSSIIIITYIL